MLFVTEKQPTWVQGQFRDIQHLTSFALIFFACLTLPIASGREPVCGRELHPLKSSAFHGALFEQQRDGDLTRSLGF